MTTDPNMEAAKLADLTISDDKITKNVSNRVKRFLYISSDFNFISGDAECHKNYNKENLEFLETILENDCKAVLRIVETVNSENTLPTRDTLFVMLALASVQPKLDHSQRNSIYTTVLQVAKNDSDFFMFMKYVSKFSKPISSGINKIISKYYLSKNINDLINDVCSRNGYHGWTHKDLIKLSHLKTDNQLLEVAFTYILKDIKAAETKAGTDNQALEIINCIKKYKELKTSKDEKIVVAHIDEFKPSWKLISPSLKKSQKVWASLINHMELSELIHILPKLYKLGLLKSENICQSKVLDILTNSDKVKESGIHPVEVFIGLRNFEKGGKPKDPKLVHYLETQEDSEMKAKADPSYKKPDFAHMDPFKCPPVINALNKTLMHSYHNIKPTSKRILFTLDVSVNMDKPCITTRNVTYMEAAVVILLSFLKSEKNVTVAAFNGDTITPVTLEKGGSISQTIKQLREVEHGAERIGAPMEWAKTNKKLFDFFINIHNDSTVGINKELNNPVESLAKYKSAMNISYTKLISINFGKMRVMNYPGFNMFDIRGFNKNVPKVMEAFMKNFF